jgi:hypothetical protein
MANKLSNYLKQAKLKINRYIKSKVPVENYDLLFKSDNPQYLTDIICNNKVISAEEYTIYREYFSRAYFMSFKRVILFSIRKNIIDEFEMFYKNSKEYLFDIYETEKYFHIICISKYSFDNPNKLKNWLYANDADSKYLNLYDIYGSFLVVNKPWYNKCLIKYTLFKRVGKGPVNNDIVNIIKYGIHLINNEFMNFLPNHYLCFP